jgi:hypothetical protein
MVGPEAAAGGKGVHRERGWAGSAGRHGPGQADVLGPVVVIRLVLELGRIVDLSA